MKKIVISFILGTIILGSCSNQNESKTSYPKDSVVYDDVEIHVSKIKIEGHDYYKVASKLNKNVSIEHLSTCKKCYDVFD
jgi:nitrous oxide reductase accessory protein NosL